ncbi:Hsp70 family protein, partial [Mycobacterium sp. GA-1999]|uniref:Hsp70 family protein n=1 Tax=Mycobacterium sp. GA-1999 TaxID=1772275 RepID=UPI00074030DE
MFNDQASPTAPLGLSVGATNLAATRDGHAAAIRPSEVTLHGQRLTGFVDRVGDPVPLVAPDGSAHRPEQLLAEALRALAPADGAADLTVAVPAHWRPSVADTLRRALHDEVPVVSDATAALTALNADPGLPSRGVVVLCDFGGSGTSITLVNASSNHAVVGETVRFADFSGDLVDQALLTHVMASITTDADPSGTAMVSSLARLRDECRDAKERLSAQTATAVAVDLPGHHAEIRVTRTELDRLIAGPLTNFLAALDDTLERYGVPTAAVSAVATIGGGARVPLITQRLSAHLRAPVVTTAQPQLTAAAGAALTAQRSGVVESATTLFDAEAPSSTFGALAWSQDDQDDQNDAELPVHLTDSPADFRPDLHFQQEDWQDDESAAPRRSPLILFGLAAAAAVVTTALFGVMQLRDDTATPVEAATTVAPPHAPAAPAPTPTPPAPQAPHATTVVVQPAQRSTPPQRHTPRHAPAPQARGA